MSCKVFTYSYLSEKNSFQINLLLVESWEEEYAKTAIKIWWPNLLEQLQQMSFNVMQWLKKPDNPPEATSFQLHLLKAEGDVTQL